MSLIAFLPTACKSNPPSPANAPNQITIAFPEGAGGATDQGANQVAHALSLEGLTSVAPDGRVTGRLAREWKWTGDRTLVVSLLPGIVLHTGQTLDAHLAAQIFGTLISPGRKQQFPGLADVTSVSATGDTELTFALARHSWWLPEDLSIPLSLGKSEYGTGPYRVVRTDGAKITLERFDRYHGGVPKIPRVVVQPHDTLRTAWASLLRGEVDMVADLPPDAVELIRNGNVRIISFPRSYQYIIGFNLGLAKFADPRIRQALNLAIDRTAIVKNVLKGAGEPATGPIWPHHWASTGNSPQPLFDPGRAEELLQAAGLGVKPSGDPRRPPARLRLTCLVPDGFIVYEHLLLEVQRQLSAVGVDIRFDVQSVDTYNNRAKKGEFETVMVDLASGPGLSRSSIFWRSPKRPDVLTSFGYDNPETESLFESLRAATSDADVRSLTRRLQDAFLRNPPAIFLAWNERARGVRKDFQISAEEGTDPLPRLWQWGSKPEDQLATR